MKEKWNFFPDAGVKYGDEAVKCRLFGDLTTTDIRKLAGKRGYRINRYPKGVIIRFQGDEYRELLVVLEGIVSAELQDPAGKRIKLETFSPESPIAPGILFATDKTLPVTISAQTDAVLLSVSKEEVLSLLLNSPECLEYYLSLTGDKIVLLAEKIRLLKFNSIQQKLAGYILGLMKKQGSDTVRFLYTREYMADLFGVARPSLSRELSRLSDAGILEINNREVKILKERALHYIVEGKYGRLLDEK